MVISRSHCPCACPETIFTPDGPLCEKCGHTLTIELTNEGTWDGDTVPWMENGQPVKLSEVTPT